MLKKIGVSILSVFITVIIFSGCATEYNLATRQQETLFYDTQKEVDIGDAVAAKVEEQFKIITDIDVTERLQKILDRVVEVCDRRDIVYFIKALDDEEVNAVSLPGGHIYVFKGLIDEAETDDQLAGVIAHEVGHVTAKHGIKRLQAMYGAMLLQIAAATQGGRAAAGVGLALNSLFSEYSQQDEFTADKLAVKYLKKAGYKPEGMLEFLYKLKEKQEKESIHPFSYWRTHPHISKRIATVNQEIKGELQFKDYLNLMD